ncbi:PP2C family protein-serine/threonine phosphatase [Carboxylicivirga sp. M1479]|uniref:PP2C family protein-serine/threonine phosphatase n=1 Tax=Carboxylicivirga sp. M1479 TaxID=2594476 RepID=UPI00117798D5|nr:PP2C family protein-serine/threonine phosphatase [Carboxylicivirga sp. M1479]TRX65838.1 PP2C family protein-serine/threonine phosphatase [Carboxylicivirga sp. M1479]
MVTQLKKKRLRLYKDRLNIILDIAQTINEDHSIEDLLSEFEILLREELEVGKVLVYTHSDEKWKNLLISGVTEDEASDINVENDLLQYDTIESITLSHPPSLKGFDAVIPLFHRYKAIGYVLIGDIEEEQQGISPTIKHLKLIQIISNLIIVFVENKRMQQELLEQEAIKKEMELASRIQNQLVPSKHQLPKTSKLNIHTYYQPHMGVGGDYYDVFQLSRNTIGFCIADVSGKGMSAAMLMSNFQAVIRSAFTYRCNLKKLIHQLNARVNESANNEKFITLFLGRYNLITRRLSYVNAGHLPPMLYDVRKEQMSHLESGCIGLGMLDFIPSIEVGKVQIHKDSKLLAFTDGLVELDDGHQVESGSEDVEKTLNNSHPLEQNFQGLRKIIDRIERDGAAFDDISLIGLEFK